MSSLAFECRKHGCGVLLTFQPEDVWLRSVVETPMDLLESVPAHPAAALRETDAYVFTLGPRRPVPWEEIPEERLVSMWLDTRYDRSKFADDWAAIAKKHTQKCNVCRMHGGLAGSSEHSKYFVFVLAEKR